MFIQLYIQRILCAGTDGGREMAAYFEKINQFLIYLLQLNFIPEKNWWKFIAFMYRFVRILVIFATFSFALRENEWLNGINDTHTYSVV